MINPIRTRAISYNVSSRFRRGAHPLFHYYLGHGCPTITPRLLTTSQPLRSPTRTAPLNLNVFIPDSEHKSKNENDLKEPIKPSPTLPSQPVTPPQPTILNPITAHHDLQSYLAFQLDRFKSSSNAETRRKLITSSVHLGTRYEYLIQSHLQQHLGFTLTRIGGKGDGGVDLIGSWTLPVLVPAPASVSSQPPPSPASLSSTSPSSSPATVDSTSSTISPTFRILLQAKRLSPHRTPAPAQMRELDGTVFSAPTSRSISAAFALHGVRTAALAQCQSPPSSATPSPPPSQDTHDLSTTQLTDLSHLPTLGILVTTRPLTSGIEKAMASSARCLMYVCLEEVEKSEGQNEMATKGLSVPLTKIRQMVWNAAASRAGLEGYDVVTKYSDSDDGISPMNGEALMMFQGQPLKPP